MSNGLNRSDSSNRLSQKEAATLEALMIKERKVKGNASRMRRRDDEEDDIEHRVNGTGTGHDEDIELDCRKDYSS